MSNCVFRASVPPSIISAASLRKFVFSLLGSNEKPAAAITPERKAKVIIKHKYILFQQVPYSAIQFSSNIDNILSSRRFKCTNFLSFLGLCGPGACVPNEAEPVMLKGPVTNRSSILLGELVAILMALAFAQSEQRKRQNHGITIFSDSQSAIGTLTLDWTSTSH